MSEFSTVSKPEGSNFDLDRARELLDLVDAAHKEFDKSEKKQSWRWDEDTEPVIIRSQNPNLPERSYKVLTRFGVSGKFFGKTEQVPFGFIATKGFDIFVVFRGTETLKEWVSDARAVQVNFLGKPSLGEVHKGFYGIYNREKCEFFNPDKDNISSIRSVIKNILTSNPVSEDSKIFVTGHSLGGALATLAALDIADITRFRTPPTLYTFASPRVGDSRFAKTFYEKSIECYRIANSEDRVTNLPWSVPFLSLLFPRTGTTFSKIVGDKLAEDQYWQHIGQPIYFTSQLGDIGKNHTIPVYQRALVNIQSEPTDRQLSEYLPCGIRNVV